MNLSGRFSSFLALIGAVALGVFAMWIFGPKGIERESAQSPLVSLDKLGHLATVRLNYSDVIEFTEKRAIDIPMTQREIPLGGTKVLLVAKGDCVVATDLRVAKYEKTNLAAHTVSIVLQTPRSLGARVNHESRDRGGSYFYVISNQGLEPIIPDASNRTAAINNALQRAQQQIERVCSSADVIATAKKNTEDVLRPTLHALGWKVTFLWK